jgi:hypothetical protein
MEAHSTIGLGYTLDLILLLDSIAVNKQFHVSKTIKKKKLFVLLQYNLSFQWGIPTSKDSSTIIIGAHDIYLLIYA